MKITDVRTMILRQNKIEMIGDGSQGEAVGKDSKDLWQYISI